MSYIEVFGIWCALNIYLLFVASAIYYNINHFMIYFFAGVFLILMFGMVEAIKKDRERNKIK